MGDITENFSRREFACECGCGLDDINTELVELLQQIRDHFEKKMTINSGCRCWKHHKAVYKELGLTPPARSKHLDTEGCIAADVVVEDIAPQLVAEAAIRYGATGVKNYESFTHIDRRDGHKWIKVTS